jgi:hypothetical protein
LDWVVAAGSSCLGILVGTLVGFYVQEAEEWDRKALYGSVSVLVGGGAIALLHFLAGTAGPTREYWFYPIGLLAGFVVGTVWEYCDPPDGGEALTAARDLASVVVRAHGRQWMHSATAGTHRNRPDRIAFRALRPKGNCENSAMELFQVFVRSL